MEILEAIHKRRSIRSYSSQPVPEELITQIIRAGMAAPSAGNEQPWHFIVITDRKILDQIPDFHPYSKMLHQVNTAIAVCGDVNLEKFKGFWVQDCAAAIENMLLSALALGLGSVWLAIYPIEERTRELKKLLRLPENVIPLAVLPLGFPAEEKEAVDRFNPTRLHTNQW